MTQQADQDVAWADWPDLLQRVAECCGAGVALRLASAYGGRELYVPRPEVIDEAHHMALHLGLATARQVAAVLGSNRIIIPLGPVSTMQRRKMLMRKMRAEGVSNGQVAKALGVHRRTVELRHQVDRRQGIIDPQTRDLFDD